MNAVTPILTPLALQDAEVLDALAAGGFESQGDIARDLGRDPSNLSKSLKALREADLVADLSLTDTGQQALAAIRRANGDGAAEPPPGFVALRADQITFDPDNARTHSGLSPQDIEEMAASIREHGLLTPLIIWDLDHPDSGDSWQLVAGERRLRGWRLAIERGWIAADTTYLCQIYAGSDTEAAEAALVENLQRVDLDNLEAAEALLKLSRQTEPPTAAADLAKRLGKEERWVQERLKVAQEATAENKDRYRAWLTRSAADDYAAKDDPDVFRWTDLRNSVKRPKGWLALDRTPDLAMLVAEMAAISEAANAIWDEPVPIAEPDISGVGLIIRAEGHGLITNLPGMLQLTLLACDWLAERGLGDDAPSVITQIQADALGPLDAASLPAGRWGTPFLNLPTPEPSPDAQASPTLRPGLTGDAFSRQLRATLAAEGEPEAVPPGGADAPGTASDPIEPQSSPFGGGGPAEPVEGVPTVDTPTPSPLATLSPLARLALLETAFEAQANPVRTRGGLETGAALHDFQLDPSGTWNALFMAKLTSVRQRPDGTGYIAVLTDQAQAALAAEYGEVEEGHIEAARAAAGFDTHDGGAYATPWLNPPAKAPAPSSSPPLGTSPRAGGGPAKPVEGVPTAASAAPATGPQGDIIIRQMRQALTDLWLAAKAPADILRRLEDGEGVGDEEITAAATALQLAAMAAAQFVPADVKEQG